MNNSQRKWTIHTITTVVDLFEADDTEFSHFG